MKILEYEGMWAVLAQHDWPTFKESNDGTLWTVQYIGLIEQVIAEEIRK